MPEFRVIARHTGAIEILNTEVINYDENAVKVEKNDRELGSFHAENEQEAWRQFGTLNPTVDVNKKKVAVNVDSSLELQAKKKELEDEYVADTLKNLQLPDDTGAVDPAKKSKKTTATEKKDHLPKK